MEIYARKIKYIQNIADFDFDISDSNKTITAHWSQAEITKRSTKLETKVENLIQLFLQESMID